MSEARGLSHFLLVGIGGCIGSALRYAVSLWFFRALPLASFPASTLAVNLIGCFAIGLLSGLAESRALLGPELRVFLVIGLLGGFTTFSAFAYESVALLRGGDAARVLASVALHVIGGFAAVWLGQLITGAR